MARLLALIRRVPWAALVAVLAGILVVNGGARLVSVELPAGSGEALGAIKQGMAMMITGGVALIAAILSR